MLLVCEVLASISHTGRKKEENDDGNANYASNSNSQLWWTGTAQAGREATSRAVSGRSAAARLCSWREPDRLENPSGLHERFPTGNVSLYSWHRGSGSGRRGWPRGDDIPGRAGRYGTGRKWRLYRVRHSPGRGSRAQAGDLEFCRGSGSPGRRDDGL